MTTGHSVAISIRATTTTGTPPSAHRLSSIHETDSLNLPKSDRLNQPVHAIGSGPKAITLCQPVTIKRTGEAEADGADAYTRFVYRNSWFVLAQTEGRTVESPALPTWNRERALSALQVETIPFDLTDGNCQGFARGRSIAVSPLAALPAKTLFHELAHVVLGHTSEGVELNDGELTPRNLRECEAESAALLCVAALELPGVEFCRGYIQTWWGQGNPIPEKAAQRILKAADQILKAGTTTGNES